MDRFWVAVGFIALIGLGIAAGCDERPAPTVGLQLPGESPSLDQWLVDRRLPRFEPSDAPALGSVELVTDETALGLAQKWAAAVHAGQPNLVITIRTVRSESPTPWWEADFGTRVALLAAPMAARERRRFQREYGYQPLRLRAAMDPVAVVAHASNPVSRGGLTLAQLRSVFGAPRTVGGAPLTWGDLGVDAAWSGRGVHAYGPDAGAPLFELVRRHVLDGGDLGPEVVRLPGGDAVVAAITDDSAGIGIASAGLAVGTVAAIPLGESEGGPFTLPTAESIADGRYPLPPRFYSLYLNHRPGMALDAPRRELIRFIYSREGQYIAAESGLAPLPAAIAAEELEEHGLSLSPDDMVLARSSPGLQRVRSASKPRTFSITGSESHSSAPK